jgi:hypothetical protein
MVSQRALSISQVAPLLLLLCHISFPASAFSPGNILSRLTGGGIDVDAASAKKRNRRREWPENGRDADYPWCFTGRLWFRPALVRVPSSDDPSDPNPPPSVSVINLFGWTIGGTVCLEYDTSPVGPYREYVTMGAVVSKRGALGQWGSSLYVSTQTAEDVCVDVWGVPAQVADIDFVGGEASSSLRVEMAPNKLIAGAKQRIEVEGWSKTRVLTPAELSEAEPKGGLPVLWTPTIKALWAPLKLLPASPTDEENALPLHRLRLSANALRLRLCPQSPSDDLGVPIPIGLVVDNVLIEIGRQSGEL